MKMMKWALLGGAALAVTATAARADDLSALKAQIEALQNRVTQLEAQPQASMPSGYSLMALRDGQGTFEGVLPERYGDRVREDSGFTLSVVPSADVAPVAEVSVSGEIRTALVYSDFDVTKVDSNDPNHFVNSEDNDAEDNLDINNRGRIFVKGKVDTAVGEVGGYFRLNAEGGGNFTDYSNSLDMDRAYGWWKFAPEWELTAGKLDMTGAQQGFYDWNVSSLPILTVGPSDTAKEQFRLTYTSGPLAFAISIEDSDTTSKIATKHNGNWLVGNTNPDRSDLPQAQASLQYTSDAFMGQITGLIQEDDWGDEMDWALSGGATLGIADHFTLVGGVVVGEGTNAFANNSGPITADEEFWGASGGVIANIAEDTRLEAGVGYEDYDHAGNNFGVNGGIFWDPVSQVTLGLGATYIDHEDSKVAVCCSGAHFGDVKDNDSLQVYFGTWLRFP